MRYTGLALVFSAAVLSACGGGGDKPADTPTPVPTAATATAMPITGATVEVKMLLVGAADFKFDPIDVTIKAGDGLKFVTVSGNPHNIAFNPMEIPADVKPQLAANMPNPSGELTSPVLLNVGDSYTISFAGIKPGKYNFTCPLHAVQGMRGTVTVQ